MKVLVVSGDDLGGYATDITEAARICYDALTSSMDMTSGFLSTEEMDAIVVMGRAIGAVDVEHIATEMAIDTQAKADSVVKAQALDAQRASAAREVEQEPSDQSAPLSAEHAKRGTFAVLPGITAHPLP